MGAWEMQPSGPVVWCGEAWVRILALPLVGCVTVGGCVHLSEHRFLLTVRRGCLKTPPRLAWGSREPSFGARARLTVTLVTVLATVPWAGRSPSAGLEPQGRWERKAGTEVCSSAPVASAPVSKWLSAGCGEQKLSLAARGRPAPQQLPGSQIRGSGPGGLGPGQLTQPGGRGLGGQLRPWSGAERQSIS